MLKGAMSCSVVMRVRCEAFRARCESGMRDADAAHIPVPEHFSQASLQNQMLAAI